LSNSDKAWWVQAEAMVGFHNAFQLGGQKKFAHIATAVGLSSNTRFAFNYQDFIT